MIDKFIDAQRIDSFHPVPFLTGGIQLLPTAAELRKQPVEHKFYTVRGVGSHVVKTKAVSENYSQPLFV